jgi:hypothetical protein
VISRDQIKAINQARQILRAIEDKVNSDPRFSRGKFSEACSSAESALLNVLLIAKHWMEEDVTTDDIHATKEVEI